MPSAPRRLRGAELRLDIQPMWRRELVQAGRPWMPPGLWEGSSEQRWAAITIDDGPHPEITPALLDALERSQAKATFFFVGERAARIPELVRAASGAGHEIGNHTWSHRPLTYLAGVSPDRQVGRTEELLAQLAPGSSRLFRPPFGVIGPGGPEVLKRRGMTPVYWSVLPGDWDPLPAEVITRRVVDAVHPGAVIVLHGGRPWHRGTVEALPGMIERLRDRGYEIVPVERMLEARGWSAEKR